MFITNNNYIVGITVFFNKTEGNTAADYAADYPQTQIMPQTVPPTLPWRRPSPRPNKTLKARLLQLLRSLALHSFLV